MMFMLAFVLIGCGTSQETRNENRRWFELTHNMNIVRVRHFDEDTKVLSIYFSYHCPSYYWYQTKDSAYVFIWKVVDIRDSVLFLPTSMTDFKIFNRIDDAPDFKMVMGEAFDYYMKGK